MMKQLEEDEASLQNLLASEPERKDEEVQGDTSTPPHRLREDFQNAKRRRLERPSEAQAEAPSPEAVAAKVEKVQEEEKVQDTKPAVKREEKREEVYYRGSLDYVLQSRRLREPEPPVVEAPVEGAEKVAEPLPAKEDAGAAEATSPTKEQGEGETEAEKFKRFMLDGETKEEMEVRLLKKYAEQPMDMVQEEVEIALAAHERREDPLAKNKRVQVVSEIANPDAAAAQHAWEQEREAIMNKKRSKLMQEVEFISPQDQNRIVGGGAEAKPKGKAKAKGRPKKVPEENEEDSEQEEAEAEAGEGGEDAADKSEDAAKKPRQSRAAPKKKGRGGAKAKAKAKTKAMKSKKAKGNQQEKGQGNKKRKQAEVDERKAKASRKSSAYHTAKRKALNEGCSQAEAELAAKKAGLSA